MIEMKLKGSYNDMGQKFGAYLFNEGITPEMFACCHIPPPLIGAKIRLDFAEKCERNLQEHAPEMLEYLRGISSGWHQDYDRVKILPLVLNFGMQSPPSCTICYVSSSYSSSGSPILFRNYDWDYSSEMFFLIKHMSPDGKNESISFSDIWAGAYGGINDKGLIMAITGAPSYLVQWVPGMSMNVLTNLVLDNCNSVDSAVKFLDSFPHMGPFHYFLADENKNIGRMLATPNKSQVEFFQDENVIQTNHVIMQGMIERQDPKKIPPSSPIRYENVGKWLNKMKGKVDLDAVEHFCTMPIAKGGIHEDSEFSGIKFGTIWSWYFDFDGKKLHVSSGNPKDNLYKIIKFKKKNQIKDLQ